MNLSTILAALPVIGPVMAAVAPVKAFIDQAIGALHPRDQVAAKSALADLMRDNDAGHARLQDKLRG